MGISVEEAVQELRNREEVFVAYSQATKLPYVTCDEETFNDQARIFATEEEIKRYLLSLIEDNKKLSQETCNDCTDSIDGIGSYEEPVTEGFMAFHAYASFDTYHIEYEARPLNKIKDATEMIEEL